MTLFAESNIRRAPALDGRSLQHSYPCGNRHTKFTWPQGTTLCQAHPPAWLPTGTPKIVEALLRSMRPVSKGGASLDLLRTSSSTGSSRRCISDPARTVHDKSFRLQSVSIWGREHMYRWDPVAAAAFQPAHVAISPTKGSLQISIATVSGGKFRCARPQERIVLELSIS